MVFDDEEENKLEYTVIHKEFKKLCEGLIEAMLWELGATPEMFGEAYDKAQSTPGYQKITKIIESIDNYETFARMMRKKNAALNEAAFKMLTQQDQQPITTPGETAKPAMTKIEETKTAPNMPTKHSPEKIARKMELQTKKEEGNLSTKETEELSQLEKEQMDLVAQISMREEEERKKIEEEEERILKQVLEMSEKEHEQEISRKQSDIQKKETDIEKKERLLREKEEKLKQEEERIRKEKEEFEKVRQQQREQETKKPVEVAQTVPTAAPVSMPAPVPEVKEKPKKKKKKKIIEAPKEEKPAEAVTEVTNSSLPKVFDLPPVSQNKKSGGMLAADMDILKAASSDLFKKNQKKDYDPYTDDADFGAWNKKQENSGKTMAELMKAKLEKMSSNEAPKVEKNPDPEDRKARLKAQRDRIVKLKQEEMKKELEDARQGNTDNKYSNNLFKELMSLDKKVTQQEAKKKKPGVKKTDSPEVKPSEDDEAEVISSQPKKKDMASLFDDDSDDEEKKKKEDAARKERYRQVMKNMTQDA